MKNKMITRKLGLMKLINPRRNKNKNLKTSRTLNGNVDSNQSYLESI